MIILIAGDYKEGKTVSACTFPKPLLMLDFNDGMLSIEHTKDKNGNLIVTERDQISTVKFLRYRFYPVTFKTAGEKEFKGQCAPSYTHDANNMWNKCDQIFGELTTDQKISKSFIDPIHTGQEKIGPFRTLVIDSLTDVFRLWDEVVMANNSIPSLRIQDYKTLMLALFNQWIPSIKALKIDYIILMGNM